jgi:beta-glucosidase/6-phospho-beta-glucosidase/beta-galactosidase
MRVAAAILGATVLAALAALPAGGSSTYQTPATSRLTTAVYLSSPIAPADENMFFNRVRNAGARAVRMTLAWNTIAPKKRPPGFDPTNPADPAYNWTYVDRLITGARAHGLEPLMTISSAPTWAGGTHASPGKLGQFARAAARRYSGSFQGLPRVRYWLVWNEPNLSRYLAPQYQQRRMVGASRYRKMVNAVAASVHGVHQDSPAL